MSRVLVLPLLLSSLAACSGGDVIPPDETGSAELPLGDVSADDSKADGVWGSALTCKSIPNLPSLPHPSITISLDGLTLHLVDASVGYDKVFPIGPGAIDADAQSSTFGESLSYWPIIGYGTHDFALHKAGNTACKFWWTDPDTGQKLPVFAGLPFMSWSGNFGIHGPIDNYRAPNGGNLRRGYVSHGCIRMEAADVLEVYARVKDSDNTPVHVQREPERQADGRRVDVPSPWVGAECTTDQDCAFAGGFCHANAYSGRGFCSVACTRACADRAGYPTTFCVADPDAPGQGMCVPKMMAQDQGCRPFEAMQPKTAARLGQTTTASVCLPGSPGWVGARCLAASDCQNGTTCTHGMCTEACSGFCPDEPGFATTMCASDPVFNAPTCMRRCTPASNAAECPLGSSCVYRNRPTTGGGYVCEPS